MRLKVSENLIKFAKLVQKKADMFIVGGFVRNSILGLKDTDVDLASKLTPLELEKLCKGSNFIIKEKSKKLGTVLVSCEGETWEHTTFRKEYYPEGGEHSPSKIKFISELQEDAKRRDFTINAIYYNILKEEVIDIYSGIYDLKKKRLRCLESPDYVFENDGLRILRMIRIASELNFSISRDTLLTAKKMVYRLNDISGQRKYDELMLILNSSERYKSSSKKAYLRGLNLLNYLGIWPNIFNSVSHVRYKMVKKVGSNQRFEGLLIDLINSLNPDCIAYYLATQFSQDGLMLSKSRSKNVIDVVCGYFDALNKMSNKEFFFRYYNSFEDISRILVKKNKFLFLKYNFFYKYINKFKIPIQIKDLKINGNDLKEKFPKLPQKKYSNILAGLLDKVFEGKIKNEREELLTEVANAFLGDN